MIEDNYVEWLVKRKDPAYAIPVRILMGLLCAVAVLLALQTVLGVIALTIVAAATYFVFQNLSVEYEYLFAEGGLRVDRILGKARRKKAFECEKEEVQIVAPSDSYMLKDYQTSGMKVVDCSSGSRGAKTYVMISQKGSEHTRVIIEPNEKMLSAMRRCFPGKLVL